ncbi:MAG: aldo/keto reductase [Sphingobacteriales bacterium]|nr:MAG: aldo/keto reductase [Sphingobacteriales bacterium]
MVARQLGNSGLAVMPWALGGNVFGWTADEPTSFSLLDAFMGAGFNFVDTADAYSNWVPGNKGGESETIIGKWMKAKGNRSQVILATKVGWEVSADKKGLSKKYIMQAVEDSLRRLQTDYIDLYQSHKDDLTTPIEETLSAYDQLVKEGKVRAIGASNFSAERLLQSIETSKQHGFPIYQSMQPHYNLYDRQQFENELEPVCLQHNIGVISYFSLASGFLTGKYRSEQDMSKSARGGGMSKFFNERGFNILAALDQLTEKHEATPAQISLTWLMARPSVTAPIASATSILQLNELAKAATIELSTDDIALLDKASAY